MGTAPPLEFNVLIEHPNFSERDRRLIFEDDAAVVFPRTATMLDVLVAAGVFPSKSQARKNWNQVDIPEGLNRFEGVGKRRLTIFVHKPPDNLPPDDMESDN
ncbi:MAG: hypothetical protein MN733_38015 [Nitrososphaera sp.]|nr:hypothetical protein [Nitrososphaera sp.]